MKKKAGISNSICLGVALCFLISMAIFDSAQGHQHQLSHPGQSTVVF